MHFLPLVILICLSACARKSHWQQSQIYAGSTQFNSSRLSYVEPGNFTPLKLEVLQTKESCIGYLYIRSRNIPSCKENQGSALLYCETQGMEKHYLVPIHEGGHKVILSQEILNEIFSHLEQGKKITLRIGSYETTLLPDGFSSSYKTFKPPSTLSRFMPKFF